VSPICRLLFAGLALVFLAAARPGARDAEALLRSGNEAFRRGDFAAAAVWYERAEVRITDPGIVALNLACCRYQLALAGGGPKLLAEAEEGYRCCTGPGDPRRPRAFYGLGNCLLLRAGWATPPDSASLRAAVKRYEECLKASPDASLAADARHNRARARLLLAQVGPPTADSGQEPPNAEEDKGMNDPGPSAHQTRPDGDGPGELGQEKNSKSGADQPGKDSARDAAAAAAGRGQLPPVPDNREPTPLAATDAAEHLRRAARRIVEERRVYRQGKARPGSQGTRDW
jgi:hypothetical protein